ncbi:MAG: flagellar basal body rod protein FlgB [Pseudomonadota bacterium]
MPLNLDNIFGVHEQALSVGARRATVLASNIANVDTPGYIARDVDFRATLAAARDELAVHRSRPEHMAANQAAELGVRIRLSNQPSVDGNTVDMQVEKAEFMRNAMRYNASLTFIGARINGLLNAIRGGQ